MRAKLITNIAWIALLFLGCATDKQLVKTEGKIDHESGGFRGVSWGSDQATVEKKEVQGNLLSGTSDDELVYQGKLLGKIPVEIVYHFKKGKLRRGTYQVIRSKSIMEYTLFHIILSRKYGRPYQDAKTSEMMESNWLTQDTEIDLLAEGSRIIEYLLEKPEVSKSIDLVSLKINYYDRAWFSQSIRRTEKEEAEVNESETYYQKLIGDWVQVFPSYRSCIGYDPFLFPGDPMFLPEDAYVYEPGSSDSDF